MSQSSKFWDRTAEKYSKQPVADEATYQRKLEITREYLSPDMEVLEFGCGTGSTALAHAPYVKHILATDFSGNMLEIARAKAADMGIGNVTFEQATLEDLDARGGSFDAVLGLNILHLIEDWEAAIRKVYARLKPGGVFISSTATMRDSKWRFLAPVLPILRLFGKVPMVRIFRERDLVASLSNAGFTIDHQWRPDGSITVFIVAKKPG